MKNSGLRTKRVLAFLLDSLFLVVPCIILRLVLLIPFSEIILLFIYGVLCIIFFVCFVLRDYLFDGCSLGKQILGLIVVDADTYEKPKAKQLIIKGLFLALSPLDTLFLLFSGRSLAECATDTRVILAESKFRKKPSRKHSIIVLVVALCLSVCLFLLIFLSLNQIKKEEHYQIAYTYLIESDTYRELGAGKQMVTLVGHSRSVDSDGAHSTNTIFFFMVKGRQYEVVCHQNENGWYVCTDCTNFR